MPLTLASIAYGTRPAASSSTAATTATTATTATLASPAATRRLTGPPQRPAATRPAATAPPPARTAAPQPTPGPTAPCSPGGQAAQPPAAPTPTTPPAAAPRTGHGRSPRPPGQALGEQVGEHRRTRLDDLPAVPGCLPHARGGRRRLPYHHVRLGAALQVSDPPGHVVLRVGRSAAAHGRPPRSGRPGSLWKNPDGFESRPIARPPSR